MTYVIHIWEHAAPDTLKTALALHEHLSATLAPPNTKFAELANALIQRFPVEVGGAEGSTVDSRGEPGAWVEFRPDGITDTAVYSMAVYQDGVDVLLPVLIDTAMALGLTVYDDQAGQVFLPDGGVLGSEGRSERSAVAPQVAVFESLSPTIAKAALKTIVAAQLKPLGFRYKVEHGGVSFRRKTPAGEQILHIILRQTSGIHLSLGAVLELDLPAELAQIVAPQTSVSLLLGPCTAMQQFAIPVPGFDPWPTCELFYPQDLQQWCQLYVDMLDVELLPLLDACKMASGLLDCDDHAEAYPVRLMPSLATLALAKYIGAPDWPGRVERYRDRMAQPHRLPSPWKEPVIAALSVLPDGPDSYEVST
ncbi:hypothetical protein [Undibacterium sp. TJN19]|uniref:hypothetical protein n=1 Tax=Undibacterium sp. TJN19 TaxID=3413055 RepID=UPI003BF04539